MERVRLLEVDDGAAVHDRVDGRSEGDLRDMCRSAELPYRGVPRAAMIAALKRALPAKAPEYRGLPFVEVELPFAQLLLAQRRVRRARDAPRSTLRHLHPPLHGYRRRRGRAGLLGRG